MTEAAIISEGLTRRFGATLAVNELSLTIERGEVFGFLGHNGAGKTTTVRLLNGVLLPTAGHSRVLGLDPARQGPALRQQTGVLTETPALDDRLSAHDSLRYAAALFGVPPALVDRRSGELLDLFGLTAQAHQPIGSFSKGMRQRMAIARTLVHDPELLFLDEPTSSLDPVAARDVHQLIRQFSRTRQRTVFLCTHNLVEAQRLCDRVAVLAHGRLLAQGAPAQLAKEFGGQGRLQLVINPAHDGALRQTLEQWTSARSDRVEAEAGIFTITGVAHDEIPELLRTLVAAGVDIFSVAAQEPTLEEVYLRLQDAPSPAAPQTISQPAGEGG